MCFGSIRFFSDEFQTRRHINTWTEENQNRPKEEKNLRKKKQFPQKNRSDFWNKGRLNMIIVTGTPGLVCITTDNMYERRKKNKLWKCSMFNPLDLVQPTNGKTEKNERKNFVGILVCPISVVWILS